MSVKDAEKPEASNTIVGTVKEHNHLKKTVQQFLKKLNTHHLDALAMLTLGICQREMKAYLHIMTFT